MIHDRLWLSGPAVGDCVAFRRSRSRGLGNNEPRMDRVRSYFKASEEGSAAQGGRGGGLSGAVVGSRWAKTIPLDDLRARENYCQLTGVWAQTTLESRNRSAEGRLPASPTRPAKAKYWNILGPKLSTRQLSLFNKLLHRPGRSKGLRQLQRFNPDITLSPTRLGAQ